MNEASATSAVAKWLCERIWDEHQQHADVGEGRIKEDSHVESQAVIAIEDDGQ